jgi:hypothetical protein
MIGKFVRASYSWVSESTSFSAQFTTETTLIIYVMEKQPNTCNCLSAILLLIRRNAHLTQIAFCLECYKHSFAGKHRCKFGRGWRMCTAFVFADGCAQRD